MTIEIPIELLRDIHILMTIAQPNIRGSSENFMDKYTDVVQQVNDRLAEYDLVQAVIKEALDEFDSE